MRVFLALDLPKKAKGEIYSAFEPLRKEYQLLAWVPAHNYHLTLHFFGDMSPTEITRVKEKIEGMLYDMKPFYMYPLEGGVFIQEKITLYLEFARQKQLEEIDARIREAFAPERLRPFVPHITLARYRIPAKQQYLLLKKKVQRLAIDTSFKIDRVHLFESELTGKIPQYRRIAAFALNP